MTIIIGIMGGAGSGKTAAASRLVNNFGARRFSFADPLKEWAIATMQFSWEQCYGPQSVKEAIDPRYGISPRKYLQDAGKAARDVFGADFWIKQLYERITAARPEIAVIDDVRYLNEASTIRAKRSADSVALKGYVWRLDAPNPSTTTDDSHPSEHEWREAEYDRLLMPAAMGNTELFTLIDDAARGCLLYPARREIAL